MYIDTCSYGHAGSVRQVFFREGQEEENLGGRGGGWCDPVHVILVSAAPWVSLRPGLKYIVEAHILGCCVLLATLASCVPSQYATLDESF